MDMMQTLLGPLGVSQMDGFILLATVLFGALELLFGYRLIRLFIFLLGFLGTTVILSVFMDGPAPILIGLLVGAVCTLCWYVGVFLIGAVLGLVIADLLGLTNQVFLVLIALICGVLAIMIRKFFLIVSTSFSGAYSIASAFESSVGYSAVITLVLTLLMAIFGIFFQYKKSAVSLKSGETTKPIPPPATLTPVTDVAGSEAIASA